MRNQKTDILKAKKLGLGGARKLSSSTSFLNEAPSTDNFFSQDTTLAFESVGKFTESDSSLLARKQVGGEVKSNGSTWFSYESIKFAAEKKYYFSKYKFIHKLIANFSFFSSPTMFFSAEGNNFFKKYSQKVTKSMNRLPLVRLSFPNFASNTGLLKVETSSGVKSLLPRDKEMASKSKSTKSDSNKNYLEWNSFFFNENSTESKTKFGTADRPNVFRNFYIPFPNTADIQQYNKFNVPLKIAAYGNDTKIQGGLLVVSTGTSAEQKICYVSPHSITTGFANAVERFKVTKKAGTFKTKSHASRDQIILKRGSGNNSFPDNLTGVYEEIVFFTKFGKKAFAKSISATGENSNPNYIIQWSGGTSAPGNCPPNISGQWVISSGKLNWLGSGNLLKTNLQLQQSGEVGTLVFSTGENPNLYTSGPLLSYDIHPTNSSSWKKSSDNSSAGPLTFDYFSKKQLSTKPVDIFNTRDQEAQFKIKSFFLESKSVNSGKLPDGINFSLQNNYKILTSGDSATFDITGLSFSYNLPPEGHLKQSEPLSSTDFYRFYNKLYSRNTNKTIATGTWDGIIPRGTNFSIEIISTKFNEKVGLNKDLYLVYSGYGSQDLIDLKSRKYLNSRVAKEYFKNIKHEEAEGAISYTAHVSNISSTNIESFAKKTATKKVQGYIYRIMQKYIPESVFINSKLRRFKRFLELKNTTNTQSVGVDNVSGLPRFIINQNQND